MNLVKDKPEPFLCYMFTRRKSDKYEVLKEWYSKIHALLSYSPSTTKGSGIYAVLTLFSCFLYSPCSGTWGLADLGETAPPTQGLASYYR